MTLLVTTTNRRQALIKGTEVELLDENMIRCRQRLLTMPVVKPREPLVLALEGGTVETWGVVERVIYRP